MQEFIIENNTLLEYTGSSENVVIPDSIQTIHRNAFRNNKIVKTLVMPDSTVFIDNRAFSSCTALESIKLSKNLRAMGRYVFSGCASLESVSIPGSLKTINYCTFKGCDSLKEVRLHEGTQRVSESAFSKCISLQSITLPATIREVKQFAFGKCRSLKSVTFLSDQQCEIGTNSFAKTHSTISFHWPNLESYRKEAEEGFRVIDDGLLAGYFGNATDVKIPPSVKAIAPFAFCGSHMVQTIDAPASVKKTDRLSLSWMPALRKVSFSGITSLGDSCFWACTKLKEVSFSSSLETVGNDCFGQCWSLTVLDLGNTHAAFQGRIAPKAYGLKRFVFPSQTQTIPWCAFYYCTSLSDVTIPSTVTEISDNAFVGCKALVSITVPENVLNLNLNVFDGCDSLREIILASHQTRISGRTNEFCTAYPHYADEPRTKQAVIFMGIQGSGKTYYFNWHFSGKFKHINLDEHHTRNKEMLMLQSCIEEGEDFVVDNTNPTKADRARYIDVAKAAGYRVIGYFFESKLQDCIRRNDLRVGKEKLPAKAIAATSNKLEIPSMDEGFDELYFIERSGGTVMLKRDWRES